MGILTAYNVVGIQRDFCLVVVLVAALIFWVDKYRFRLFFGCVIFYFLGIHGMNEKLNNVGVQSFKKYYKSGDDFVVKINVCGNKASKWVRAEGEIVSVYHKRRKQKCIKKIVLFVERGKRIRQGDLLLTDCSLNQISNKGNPGEFDAVYYWFAKGVDRIGFIREGEYQIIGHHNNFIEDQLVFVREHLVGVLKSQLKGEELSLAKALILGDRSELENETLEAFGNTGAMHVLAVSGLHIGILQQGIILFLGLFPRIIRKKHAILISLAFIWFYCLLTGFSASVLRSVVMFTVLSGAQYWGRNYLSINTLFSAGFFILLFNPLTLFDIGFQLSFGAMLGIFLYYRKIEELFFVSNFVLKKIWETTAVGLAAQVFTVPFVLYYFHQFPNYFMLTNIALMSVTGIILFSGVILFIVGRILFLRSIMTIILFASLWITLRIVHEIELLPGAFASGFEYSTSILLLLLAIGFLPLVVNLRGKFRWLLYSIPMVLLAYVIGGRYSNVFRNEVCVFNCHEQVLSVKFDGDIFCFYNFGNQSKINQMLKSYMKVCPGRIHLFSLRKSYYKVNKEGCNIEVYRKKDKLICSVNKLLFCVLPKQRNSDFVSITYRHGVEQLFFRKRAAIRIGLK